MQNQVRDVLAGIGPEYIHNANPMSHPYSRLRAAPAERACSATAFFGFIRKNWQPISICIHISEKAGPLSLPNRFSVRG